MNQVSQGNQEGNDAPWGKNLHLGIIEKSKKVATTTNCWVRTHFLEHLNKGLPLIGIPLNFSFSEFIRHVRNDSDQTIYNENADPGWEVHHLVGDYYQSLQRCNNYNRWWEKTLLHGKQPINCERAVFIGNYENCSQIPEVGYKRPSKEQSGRHVMKGSDWYWLCGNKACKDCFRIGQELALWVQLFLM